MPNPQRAWDELEPPFRTAVELAWASARAGSLGVGAVVTEAGGSVVSTGRNRLMESDAGDDRLAGSAMAHAETNALAKLPWRSFEDAGLSLWSTLQPCLMCLATIRMSPIRDVHYLAPDPLFDGIEALPTLNEFVARSWPAINGPRADPFAALGAFLPVHQFTLWEVPLIEHMPRMFPRLVDAAVEVAASGQLVEAATRGASAADVVELLWERLVDAADDLQPLPDRT